VPTVKGKLANFYQRGHEVEFSVCPRLKYSIATPITFYCFIRTRQKQDDFYGGRQWKEEEKLSKGKGSIGGGSEELNHCQIRDLSHINGDIKYESCYENRPVQRPCSINVLEINILLKYLVKLNVTIW
jgi:hypothetical protein